MRDATFFPVLPHFLADKGIWIFSPNVAARADIAPSRQHFFHFHLRLLSSGALACRINKLKRVDFLLSIVAYCLRSLPDLLMRFFEAIKLLRRSFFERILSNFLKKKN